MTIPGGGLQPHRIRAKHDFQSEPEPIFFLGNFSPGGMWRGALLRFPSVAVARLRIKIWGGRKCSEPQGPVFFVEKNGWAQRNWSLPHILAGERAAVSDGKRTWLPGDSCDLLSRDSVAFLVRGSRGRSPPPKASQKRYSVNNASLSEASFATQSCRLSHQGSV